MKLDNLPKVVARRRKALGRGIGSGRGKTSGRGMKGQKARGKIPAANVGAGLILYKKLPYRRGWSRRGSSATRPPKPVLIRLEQLNILKPKTKVDLACLVDNKLVSEKLAKKKGVKILDRGGIKVALDIALPVSENAKQKIVKVGGSVVG